MTVTTLDRRPSSSHEESGLGYQDFVKIAADRDEVIQPTKR
jgi:hypothetical protein